MQFLNVTFKVMLFVASSAFEFLESYITSLQNGHNGDYDDSENGSDIDVNYDDQSSSPNSDDSGDESDIEPTNLPQNSPLEWTDQLSEVQLEDFIEPSGPIYDLPTKAEPIDYFNLFLLDSLIDLLVDQNNLYAEQCQAMKGHDPYWKPVNHVDIKHFLYINTMFGIHYMLDYRLYWMDDKMCRVEAIAEVMGRQRYEILSQYFHINDSSKQPLHTDAMYDLMTKVHPLLDHVRKTCSAVYKPVRQISTDEAMVAFNGRLYFKQYIQNKPTPWGL